MREKQAYLLDSQIIVWSLKNPGRIETRHSIILEAGIDLFASVASIWELEIKRAAGKIEMPDDLLEMLALAQVQLLPITVRHAIEAAHLPFHHRDPFDRMLIAQARVERLTLLTTDRSFARYNVALA